MMNMPSMAFKDFETQDTFVSLFNCRFLELEEHLDDNLAEDYQKKGEDREYGAKMGKK